MDQCSKRHDIPSALQATHQPTGARSTTRNRPSLQVLKVLTGRRLGDQPAATSTQTPSTPRRSIPIRFPNRVSSSSSPTCSDATCLTRCHPASVSVSCHFSDNGAGAFRHSRLLALIALPPAGGITSRDSAGVPRPASLAALIDSVIAASRPANE